MSQQVLNCKKRVVVVSGDTLPLPGLPTTGAGLRAWGLGKGLEARGYDVYFLMPEFALNKFALKINPDQFRTCTYSYLNLVESLNQHITELDPDVVVLQHWHLASSLQIKSSISVVIDFHGPMLLEALYQERSNYQQLVLEKLKAIASKGDYFTCAGEKQRCYFYAWLIMAGFDLRDDLIGVVPVCLSPNLPEREPFEDDIHFVYGGVYLPWQDPILPLQILLKTLEDHGQGHLDFFGGQHISFEIPTGSFETLREKIRGSSRATDYGMVPHEQLIEHYRRSHVAFDLMQRNPERELAFTTRTVEYLWCGLPVIYNNYGELSAYIKDYDAGWTLDPQNAAEIRAVIEEILENPAIIAVKSANARRLAYERLNWEKAIEPLDRFCRQPLRPRPANILSPIKDLPEQNHRLTGLVEELLPFVQRSRRSLPARLTALAKESGKSLLKRRFSNHHLERPAFALPLLRPGHCHGQVIQTEENYLSRISVLIGTHQRINTCDLTLHLREKPEAEQDIRTVTINAAMLRDNQYCHFNFGPLPDSKGCSFYFCIESVNAVISDTVSLFAYVDRSPNGAQRYENGQGVAGELVYSLNYRL